MEKAEMSCKIGVEILNHCHTYAPYPSRPIPRRMRRYELAWGREGLAYAQAYRRMYVYT